ncbi:MAG: glycosyltransferase [Thermodesulfovibrionales bacterium]
MSFFEPQLQVIASFLIVGVGFLLRMKNLRVLLLLLSMAVQVRYLLWRGLFTLDTFTALGFAVTICLYFAECYGLLQNLFFSYQAAHPLQRVPRKPKEFPLVDIFVPIVNEPLDILKRTLIGCLAQDYPRDRFTVYVLDDGARDDVRDLSDDLGCRYVRRESREHAKAGNLNNALRIAEGDLVAIFDVDHVPVAKFLERTVGFFEDPKVAFVQTPHHFYNPDVVQANLRLQQEIMHEQDLFFRIVQPGRDAHNSAFFAGSAAIFRSRMLREIGGFRTETITEDLHTSLRIHERGWKSCYLNEKLSAGLSPESIKTYLQQRERWAIGAMQTLFRDNPLFKGKLSITQRIDYFASIYYFFHGIPRIVYILAPLSFLLLGISPIRAEPLELLHYFFSYYIVAVLVMETVGKGYRRIFWSDVYESLMCFSLSRAVIKALLPSKGFKFVVTPKGLQSSWEKRWKDALPYACLLSLLVIGICVGFILHSTDSKALLISAFWAAYNAFLLLVVFVSSIEQPQRRRMFRLNRRIPCLIRGDGKEARGYTVDISEGGVAISLDHEFYFLHPGVELELRGGHGETTRVAATVLRQERHNGGFIMALKFRDVAEDTYQSIIRQMYSPLDSWSENGGKSSTVLKDAALPLIGVIRRSRAEKALRRLHPRVPVRRECSLVLDGRIDIRCHTVDVSYAGLSVRLNGTSGKIDSWSDPLSVSLGGVVLHASVVAQEAAKNGSTLHLKILNIERGEDEWRTVAASS